jgi:hypothetical protein
VSEPELHFTSELVAAVGSVWSEIRRRHPDVPAVVLSLGSGSESRGRLKLGHFAAERWIASDGDSLAELFLGGEGLEQGSDALLDTLLHEAAHGLAHARGVADTSRQGRYHNQRFRRLAAEVGLSVATAGDMGWSATSLEPGTRTAYGVQLAKLERALTAHRVAEPVGARPARDNGVVLRCACPRKIRASRRSASGGTIQCGTCHTDFVPEG